MSVATTEHAAIRTRDMIASEVTKIITLPGAILAPGLTLLANTLFAIIAASDTVRFGAGKDTAPLSAFASVMFAPLYAFLALPVYAAASEYQGGQLRMSLTAVPSRCRLATAKFLAMIVVATPAALLTLIPGRVILGTPEALDASDLLLDIGRWTAAYLFMSVIAFGLAAILRSTVAPLSILVILALFVNAGFLQWPEGVRFLPDQASMSLLGTPAFEVTELPAGIAALVLSVWATAATTGYVVALMRRDS